MSQEDLNVEKEYSFGKQFKRTLDSDEDDDETDAEKYNILDSEQLEGVEKATVDFDGDIRITPFNMDEELETGHFDKEGTYIFNKEDDIRDNWLDNVNWSQIKPDKHDSNDNDDKSEENDSNSSINIEELYKIVVELINPGETIQKAIQRYGKSCKKNYNKSQKRKLNSQNDEESDERINKEKMLKIISIADQILQSGDMDIYERKFEEFQLHLNKSKESSTGNDMFSDDFDSDAMPISKTMPLSSQVLWEYKWEDKDDAPIYGPYQSNDMLAWTNEGYFNDGVFVRRKESQDSKFYSSKRIDFELYI